MKLIILLKIFFSIVAAIVLANVAYFGLDGHQYTLWQGLFIVALALSIWLIWNRNLYNAIVNDKSENFKNSEINQMYYFLFEFFGFLMAFLISISMGYDVVLFLIKNYI
jgi:hypothetical protein